MSPITLTLALAALAAVVSPAAQAQNAARPVVTQPDAPPNSQLSDHETDRDQTLIDDRKTGGVGSATEALIDKSAPSRVEFEEDFSLPIVYLHLIVDSGSTADPAAKLGLANIAGRMLLRGTHHHKKLEFNELVNQLGGELDVDVREEGTIYSGAVLSENLGAFLELFDEALSKPKFTADELSKLKKETLGEILERKGNDRALVQYNFYRYFYGDHPYGNPVTGTQAGVTAINYKDVVDYYASRFSGKTLHLFGTGAAKKDEIVKWFLALSDKLTAIHPDATAAPAIAKHTLPKGRRCLLVNKPGATQSQILLGGQGIRPEDPGFYAVQLGNYPFGGPSFQARMMTEIRVKRGWTYGAYNTFRFGRVPKHYAMFLFPKTTDTTPAIGLTLELFENWVKNGITQAEFDFAKSSLVNKAPFNFDTSKKRLENAASEYLTGFPRGYNHDFADNISKVSLSDVNESIREFFKPENLTLTVVGDGSKLEPLLGKLPGFAPPEVKSYLED